MADPSTTRSRGHAGIDLPEPGDWTIDPGHAEVSFVGRRFGLSRVRGRFRTVDGTVTVAQDLARSTIEVTIDMASVDTGSPVRDDNLRSSNLFDVEHHPTATFRATRIEPAGTAGAVIGDLTVRGVTCPVVLDVEVLGTVLDPWGTERAILRATGRIDREAWGIDWNLVIESGALAVSTAIAIEIDVELVRA